MTEFPVRYDYSEATFGGMSDPSDDEVEQDGQGHWFVVHGGERIPGVWYPTRELAVNRVRRRIATYEADWKQLHRLEREMDELRGRP